MVYNVVVDRKTVWLLLLGTFVFGLLFFLAGLVLGYSRGSAAVRAQVEAAGEDGAAGESTAAASGATAPLAGAAGSVPRRTIGPRSVTPRPPRGGYRPPQQAPVAELPDALGDYAATDRSEWNQAEPGEAPVVFAAPSESARAEPARLQPEILRRSPSAAAQYSVQVAAYSDLGEAIDHQRKLIEAGYDAYVAGATTRGGARFYRVRFGEFDSLAGAQDAAARFRGELRQEAVAMVGGRADALGMQ